MFKFLRQKKIQKKGFTLLEMLISITLFSIVTTIAFTALYSIMDANEKAKTIKSVVNNLNIAMESMTREIRVGYDYCDNVSGTSCDTSAGGSSDIFFTNKDSCSVRYTFSGSTIRRSVSGAGCTPIDYRIVGEDIVINNLQFFINGTDTGDFIQPRVLILLKGETTRPELDTKFDIQTTVSQRNLAP